MVSTTVFTLRSLNMGRTVELTENAAEMMRLAVEFAKEKRHSELLELHIIYGLMSLSHGHAFDILQSLGFPTSEVLQIIDESLASGRADTSEETRFSREADNLLHLTREYMTDPQWPIDTDDVLYTMALHGQNVPYALLSRLGLECSSVAAARAKITDR